MELQCNLLTPLAHVRLSKHQTTKTTTMYRSLRIERNGIYPTYLDQIRKLTETADLSLLIHWRNFPTLTNWNLQSGPRMLGKLLLVIILPISGSCQSIVYSSVTISRNLTSIINIYADCVCEYCDIYVSEPLSKITKSCTLSHLTNGT